jgi:hypothetical protein
VDLDAIVVSDNDSDDPIIVVLTLDNPLAGELTTRTGGAEFFDAGAGQWRITGTALEVNQALADVAFVAAPDFAQDARITVSIRDAAGTGPADGLITLQATAVNDAPGATFAGNITVNEDAGPQTIAGFAAGFVGGGTDEVTQTLRYELITNNPTLFAQAPAISADGILSFAAADNTHGNATITVRVIDSGDTLNGGQNTSIEYTFSFSVTADPDAPSATNVSQTIAFTEDDGPVALGAIVVSDVDANDMITATLTLADSGAGTLSSVDGSGAVVPSTNGQWQFSGTTAQINAALAQIRFEPAPDYARDTSIAVQIEDQSGNAAPVGTIILQATAVNDAPVATQLDQFQRFIEDATNVLLDDIAVSDVDSGDVVTATLRLADPNAGTLTSNSGQGESYDDANGLWRVSGTIDQVSTALAAVSFAPASDFAGPVSIFTIVSDQAGSGPPSGEIRLEATPVNDAPVIALAGDIQITEDAAVQRIAGFATLIGNGGVDERDQSIAFDVSTDNPSLFAQLPRISAQGELVYEAAPDANGVTSITVTARDDGGRANNGQDTADTLTFTLQINPVNDAPEASNRFVVAPPTGIVVLSSDSFGFADPSDGDRFDGIFISSLPAQGELLLDGTTLNVGAFVSAEDIAAGRLSLSSLASPGDSLLLNFDFLVRDNGGTSNGGVNLASSPSTLTVSVDVPKIDNTTATFTQEENDSPTADVTADATLAPEEIFAAEQERPTVETVFTPPQDAAGPPDVVALAPVNGADQVPTIATLAPPTQDATTVTPSVARVMVTLLDTLRASIPDATVVEIQPTATLDAATQVLVDQLSELRNEVSDEQASEELVIMQSSAVAFGLSVGYVSWLLRGGVLLSSMLTSLPAWRFIDPLPIFSGVKHNEDDDESLQDIVSNADDDPAEDSAP